MDKGSEAGRRAAEGEVMHVMYVKGGADGEWSGELGEAQLIGCWARPSRGRSHRNGNL